MPVKPSDERIVVGQLAGAYGIKGWVKLRSFTEPAENILEYRPWFLRTCHGLREVIPDDYKTRPQGMVVHFNGVDDRDVAAQLGRALIEIDETHLAPLPDGEYYWHELQGLDVVSAWEGQRYLLGRIKHLMETGANDVIVVEPTSNSVDDRERLVPYVPGQFVERVDVDSGSIVVNWDPEF